MSKKEKSTDPDLSPSERKTRRGREAEEAIAAHEDSQKAVYENMGRLREERLKREAMAGDVVYPAPVISDNTPIENVLFTTRVKNVLTHAGLKTIGEIREASDATLLSFPDMGPESVAYLREKLGVKAKGK
jgi:DNA-directed RNA polymerase alpha subunit